MITQIDSYVLECDHCLKIFEDYNGFSVFVDQNAAIEKAKEAEWIEHEGKHYCPGCYIIDDNDSIIIKKEEMK
jgi:hypothetical protein